MPYQGPCACVWFQALRSAYIPLRVYGIYWLSSLFPRPPESPALLLRSPPHHPESQAVQSSLPPLLLRGSANNNINDHAVDNPNAGGCSPRSPRLFPPPAPLSLPASTLSPYHPGRGGLLSPSSPPLLQRPSPGSTADVAGVHSPELSIPSFSDVGGGAHVTAGNNRTPRRGILVHSDMTPRNGKKKGVGVVGWAGNIQTPRLHVDGAGWRLYL